MKNNRPNPGPKGEELVEEALKLLKARNPHVSGFYHPPKDGDWDKHQIDFVIFFKSRLALPLQVKAGKTASKAVKEHYKKRPEILAIQIRVSHNAEKISEQIEHLIIRYLKNPMKDRTIRPDVKKPAP